MSTRLERSLSNKRAHAIRRALTQQDYRAARAAGESVLWLSVWSRYEAMSNDVVLMTLSSPTPAAAPAPPAAGVVDSVKPEARRRAPAHIVAVAAEYRLTRESWESGLNDAMAGGSRNGKPARGEKYTDEERDYRAAYPPPVYGDFLKQASAEARGMVDAAIASGRLEVISVSA